MSDNKKQTKKTMILVLAAAVVILCAAALWFGVFGPAKQMKQVKEQAAKASTGDVIQFGRYAQDAEGKKAPIDWIVLKKEENRVLVVSEYGLESRQYHESEAEVTWEGSSMREWLNGEFSEEAFTDKERSLIPVVSVPADPNPDYDTDPGKDTKDQIFLLSMKEAEEYLGSDEARVCKATEYAASEGMFVSEEGNCRWWMRTPGYGASDASYVSDAGEIYKFGNTVNYRDAVRPALWIEFK